MRLFHGQLAGVPAHYLTISALGRSPMRATIATVMSALTIACVDVGPALASCSYSGEPLQFGAASRDAEKDTFGLMCGRVDVEPTISARREILQVGISTGEAEKDTLGYLP